MSDAAGIWHTFYVIAQPRMRFRLHYRILRSTIKACQTSYVHTGKRMLEDKQQKTIKMYPNAAK
jgi:hypothetical protein